MNRHGDERRRALVIGLGLIGGSVARDLSARGWHVIAHDRHGPSLEDAISSGVVHERLAAGNIAADVAVLAVPISTFRAVLNDLAPRLGRAALLMDVCSTKRTAIAAAEAAGVGERFVGAHPMTGDHRSGWAASHRGRFDGALVYLCRTRTTSERALSEARDFWETLGAGVQVTTAEAHDRLVAYTSHLPQVVSRALALALADGGTVRAELGPGGRDTTRLAAGDVDLWISILMDNADEVLPALSRHERSLAVLRRALERRDAGALGTLLAEARRWSG